MPVSAKALACRAAIWAAIAIWGVTCVPDANRAATLRTEPPVAAAAEKHPMDFKRHKLIHTKVVFVFTYT